MLNFKDKYLKYKKKYIELKKQLGGQNCIIRNEYNRKNIIKSILYNIDTIKLLPHVEKQPIDYWKKLIKKYPENYNYFTSEYRKLQLKVLHKMQDDVAIIFDTTYPDSNVYKILHYITDKLKMNVIPTAYIPIGKPEYKGKINDYMNHHNCIILLIKPDDSINSNSLNPLNSRHFITVTKKQEKDKYTIFDSNDIYTTLTYTLKNIANFIGEEVDNSRLVFGQYLEAKIDQISNEVEKTTDFNKLSLINDEFKKIKDIYNIYGSYLFANSNIIQVINAPLQTIRPVCFFWSILRTLHPEKSEKDLICMLDDVVARSGINDVPNINDEKDLVLIHIIESFVKLDNITITDREEKFKYRTILG